MFVRHGFKKVLGICRLQAEFFYVHAWVGDPMDALRFHRDFAIERVLELRGFTLTLLISGMSRI